MVLRIDRRPAVELQAAGRRGITQKGKRQLSILRSIARAGDDHTRVGARQDLGLAVEVGRARQQRTERRAAERPARFLADLIIKERQGFAVGDEKQIPAAVLESYLA